MDNCGKMENSKLCNLYKGVHFSSYSITEGNVARYDSLTKEYSRVQITGIPLIFIPYLH